jgi:arsenate reductase-like glutaredoxin family protein
MDFFIYLSSCSTCKRIIEALELPEELKLIDIKKEPLSTNQLDFLYQNTGSYLALINKRAQLFRQRQIDTQQLTEDFAKNLLLDHYSFLKRPVLVYRNEVFVGNSKAVVAEAKKWIDEH